MSKQTEAQRLAHELAVEGHVQGDSNRIKAADELRRQEALIAELAEALEELADLMDDVLLGSYVPDSFTTQPARAALAKVKQ